MRWSMQLMGLISTVILARLLSPEDFGLIAMAMIFVGFLDVFADIGVDSAVLRHPDPQRAHYDTAWTMQFIIGLTIGLALFLLAPLAAWYFDDLRVQLIIQWLAIVPIIKGMENIGVVDFRRELHFSKDFRYNFTARAARFAVTVTLAFLLQSYWVLVIGMIFQQVIRVLLSYWMHSFRPKFSFSKVSDFKSVSVWAVAKSVGEFLSVKLDQLLIGGLFGVRDMGAYFMSSELGKLITYESVLPVGRAAMAGYARIQNDKKRLAAAYERVAGVLSYISIAVGFGLAVVAEDFTFVVLGEKWVQAVPLLRILAVSWALSAISTATWPLFAALGRWNLWALLTWGQLLLLAVCLGIVAHYQDMVLLAEARLVASGVFVIFALYLSFRSLFCGMAAVFRVLFRPLVSGVVMVVGVSVFHQEFEGVRMLSLAFDVFLGALIYVSTALLLWYFTDRSAGVEKDLLDRLACWVRRK